VVAALSAARQLLGNAAMQPMARHRPESTRSHRRRSIPHIGSLVALLAGLAAAATGCDDDSIGKGQSPSTACCNPEEEPGAGGSPLCVEGASCCADGTWSCNDADGSSACDQAQGVCTATACCDPAEQPGVGGRPYCTEGATCCASGSWSCNDADGSTYCDDVGSVCLPLSAIRFADQG
jgi:hypothetical protein